MVKRVDDNEDEGWEFEDSDEDDDWEDEEEDWEEDDDALDFYS